MIFCLEIDSGVMVCAQIGCPHASNLCAYFYIHTRTYTHMPLKKSMWSCLSTHVHACGWWCMWFCILLRWWNEIQIFLILHLLRDWIWCPI